MAETARKPENECLSKRNARREIMPALRGDFADVFFPL